MLEKMKWRFDNYYNFLATGIIVLGRFTVVKILLVEMAIVSILMRKRTL